MTKKQSTKRANKNVSADETEGNVDKIRDILFGSQMRDYEQRLDALEKRLTQRIERSSRDLERRIERLDAFARREVDKLAEQVKVERKERTTDAKKGAGDLSDFADQVEAWFTEVDEQLSSEAKDLRSLVHEQANDLTTQIREAHDQLHATLQKETTQLADGKLAREDLAALLSEVAMRLTKDFKLPKP